MHHVPIPDDVKRFILASIPSIPYLEALLLLRTDAGQSWQSKSLAKRLYVSDKLAAAVLAGLHDTGILEVINTKTSSYRYCPASDELREIVDRLAEVYATNLVGITHFVHSRLDKKAQ